MKYRFTPRQISKAKQFLKGCSLKAFEINILTEILGELDNAVDEQQVKHTNKVKSNLRQIKEPPSKPTQIIPKTEEISIQHVSPILPVQSLKEMKVDEHIPNKEDSVIDHDIIELTEQSDNVEDIPLAITEEIVIEESKHNSDITVEDEIDKVIIGDALSDPTELDNAGIFGVIDRRTNKHKVSAYI